MMVPIARLLSKAACFLPETQGRKLAGVAGKLFARLWLSERRFLEKTIDRVFFRMNRIPPRPLGEIIDRTFFHFAQNIYEVLRFPLLSEDHLNEVFSFSNFVEVDKAMEKGKGVILMLPHIGNWELLGAAIAHKGYPLHSFFMAQKENVLGSILDYFRGFSKITLHDRDRGTMGALRALKRGEVLAMIADQDGGNQAVYGSFLGHWVSIPAGPANWSLKTGAAVIPLFSLRRNNSGNFFAHFCSALPEVKEASHEEMVVFRTEQMIQWMENIILSYPDQYLWFYSRFKPRHEAYLARLKASGRKMEFSRTVYGIFN